VADSATANSGGSGHVHRTFQAVSLRGDVVAFAASGPAASRDIYLSAPANGVFPAPPIKVMDLLDTLDGKTIDRAATGAGRVVRAIRWRLRRAFSDGSQGVLSRAGGGGVAHHGGGARGQRLPSELHRAAGYNYSLESRTDPGGRRVVEPGFTKLANGSISQTTVTNRLPLPMQFYRVQKGRKRHGSARHSVRAVGPSFDANLSQLASGQRTAPLPPWRLSGELKSTSAGALCREAGFFSLRLR